MIAASSLLAAPPPIRWRSMSLTALKPGGRAMRTSGAVLLIVVVSAARADGPRHGVALDLKTYPQATPQQALASVLNAVADKRFDYLTAQPAHPTFIDDHVRHLYDG